MCALALAYCRCVTGCWCVSTYYCLQLVSAMKGFSPWVVFAFVFRCEWFVYSVRSKLPASRAPSSLTGRKMYHRSEFRRACSNANANSIELANARWHFFFFNNFIPKLWLFHAAHTSTRTYLFTFASIWCIWSKFRLWFAGHSLGHRRQIELHSHVLTTLSEKCPCSPPVIQDPRENLISAKASASCATHRHRRQDKNGSAFRQFFRFRAHTSRLSELNLMCRAESMVLHFNFAARLFNSFFEHQRCDERAAANERNSEMQPKTFELQCFECEFGAFCPGSNWIFPFTYNFIIKCVNIKSHKSRTRQALVCARVKWFSSHLHCELLSSFHGKYLMLLCEHWISFCLHNGNRSQSVSSHSQPRSPCTNVGLTWCVDWKTLGRCIVMEGGRTDRISDTLVKCASKHRGQG